MEQDFSNRDVVVTFGYALVQVQEDPAALEEFSDLIHCLFPSRFVASWSRPTPTTMGRYETPSTGSAAKLETALNEFGIGLEDRVSPVKGSIMFARLNME